MSDEQRHPYDALIRALATTTPEFHRGALSTPGIQALARASIATDLHRLVKAYTYETYDGRIEATLHDQ